MRKASLVVILVLVVAAAVLAVRHHQHARAQHADTESAVQGVIDRALGQPTTGEVVAGRIWAQVSQLERLSEVETVRLLDNMEFYFWPGARIGAETIIFHNADGNLTAASQHELDRNDLERILSNRVFRKAFQDLSKLPKDQASELLGRELEDTLSQYLDMFNGFLETRSWDVNILSSRNGEPVLRGLRYKIFALVLIAGSLELTDIHEIIRRIDAIAIDQEADISRIEDWYTRMQYTNGVSLRNNLILASGMYGTSSRNEDARLALFENANRFVGREMVGFSSPATEFDVLAPREMHFLASLDDARIHLRYFAQMTNEDLNELRRILDTE